MTSYGYISKHSRMTFDTEAAILPFIIIAGGGGGFIGVNIGFWIIDAK